MKVIAPIERFFVKNRPFSRGYPAGRNITIGTGVIHRNEFFLLCNSDLTLGIACMRQASYYMLICLTLLILAGCATTPPMHFVDSDTSKNDGLATGVSSSQFSLTTGVRDFQASAAAKDGSVGEVSGEATRRSILFGLVEWGDNGVGTAAQKAGIKHVKTVQNGGTDILWGIAYSEQQTIVTGSTNEVVAQGNVTENDPASPKIRTDDKKAGRLVLVNPEEPGEVLVSTKPVEGVQQ